MPRIYVLIDNKRHAPGLATEHGLSMLVELDNGERWLWDTGAGKAFLDNATAMGVNLGGCSGAALSHGHWDHTGGLQHLLAETSFNGPVHGHPDLHKARYSLKDKPNERFIGMDTGQIEWPPPGFVPVQDSLQLAPGLVFLTSIPRLEGNCQACNGFSWDQHGQEPDSVPDDACLLLETAHGPAVILGCCHSGLANTLIHVLNQTGGDHLHAVAGGMHLYDASPEAMQQAVSSLEALKVERIFPGHCTGEHAICRLSERLPGKVRALGSGLVIDL